MMMMMMMSGTLDPAPGRQAERFVRLDVCSECFEIAAALPRPPDAVGASCTADYFTGAPRVER